MEDPDFLKNFEFNQDDEDLDFEDEEDDYDNDDEEDFLGLKKDKNSNFYSHINYD